MALDRKFFFGFQTGGEEEFHAVVASGSIQTSPATWSDKEANYCYRLTWKQQLFAPVTYAAQISRSTVGFNIRFGAPNQGQDTDFYRQRDGDGNVGIRLRILANTDGDLQVVDKDNIVQATIADVFAADTWYRVTLKYAAGSAEPTRVWVVPSAQISNDAAIFAAQVNATTPGTQTVTHTWHNSGWTQGLLAPIFIGSTYCFTDTEADVDVERILGAFVTLLFNDTDQDGTAQFGTNLDAGRWDNTADIPVVDADVGSYNLNSRLFSSGGVSADDGTNNGPKGQADVNGRLLQILGIWRAKKLEGKGNNWDCDITGKMGGNASATTDGTVGINFGDLSTSFAVFTNYETVVPSTYKDFYGQLGFSVIRSCPFGEDACLGTSTLAQVSGMWLEMLHEEPRLLIVDGKSQLIGA